MYLISFVNVLYVNKKPTHEGDKKFEICVFGGSVGCWKTPDAVVKPEHLAIMQISLSN